MDEMPELPFEQVLSYLSLKDRLKARTISRAWRNTFDRYPVKTLCFSEHPIGRILGKGRWVSSTFAENFISSTRFASFFDTFGPTILSSLRHLRLCDLNLTEGDPTAFARTLNSLDQLQKLDIVRAELNQQDVFNLPMLTSLQLEDVYGIEKLTLEVPRLRDVKILDCSALRVEIVHGESVEWLLVDCWEYTDMKKLKNLQYLYVKCHPGIDPLFLSTLHQLKEIHTYDHESVCKLFEQKQRSGRADLKIYFCGLFLNGPEDPAMNAFQKTSLDYLTGNWLVCLTENPSRLADEFPFYSFLYYSAIEEFVTPALNDVLKRCTVLNQLIVSLLVQDTQRFLDLLKNCENIVKLMFNGDQPQDLFNRLPEYCAVQELFINHPPTDLAFLFRLKHLIHLNVDRSIDIETVRRAFDELPALCSFKFSYGQKRASIRTGQSKQFRACVGSGWMTFYNLNAAIEFITGIENRPIQ